MDGFPERGNGTLVIEFGIVVVAGEIFVKLDLAVEADAILSRLEVFVGLLDFVGLVRIRTSRLKLFQWFAAQKTYFVVIRSFLTSYLEIVLVQIVCEMFVI